jgi:hypothetical protein
MTLTELELRTLSRSARCQSLYRLRYRAASREFRYDNQIALKCYSLIFSDFGLALLCTFHPHAVEFASVYLQS